MKKPWAYDTKIIGFIEGTLIKAQDFLIRFLHYLLYVNKPLSEKNPKP